MPRSFSALGQQLAAERDRSVLVAPGPAGQLLEVATGRPASRRRLVHLEPSPEYCEPDPETGFSGTAGRPCRRNSTGESGTRRPGLHTAWEGSRYLELQRHSCHRDGRVG